MKKRPAMLSATFVKNVNVPGRYGDGRGGLGLTLRVKARLPRRILQVLGSEHPHQRPENHHRPRGLSGNHPSHGQRAGRGECPHRRTWP